jgi:tight adherence protein C
MGLLVIVAILVLLVGIGILMLGLRSARSTEMDRRLYEFVVEPGAQQTRWAVESPVQRPELEGSLIRRTIVPAFQRVGRFFGRLTPRGSIDALNRQLAIAGNPLGLHGREFYGVRILFILLGAFLAFMLVQRGQGESAYLLVAIVTAVMMFYLPILWLRSVVRRKQNKILKALPDALDMLSVCADAGLGFDQSLQRVSESWKSPLATELGRIVAEMNMGQSRAQAMRNMSDRLDIPEISSFVAVILQSDELGMSISDTLHAQANQMRIERRYWAQEQARKIPTKMLFPLVFLILPAMFAVILGPVIPALRDIFSNGILGGP